MSNAVFAWGSTRELLGRGGQLWPVQCEQNLLLFSSQNWKTSHDYWAKWSSIGCRAHSVPSPLPGHFCPVLGYFQDSRGRCHRSCKVIVKVLTWSLLDKVTQLPGPLTRARAEKEGQKEFGCNREIYEGTEIHIWAIGRPECNFNLFMIGNKNPGLYYLCSSSLTFVA